MPDYRFDSKANKASPTFTGAVTIPTINLTGGQIAFPATAVPSADANTLDDYEEGSFETAITMGTSGTATINTDYDTFQYTKIGRQVSLTGNISITSVSSPVGTMSFSLPFTSANIAGNATGPIISTYGVDYTTGTFCFLYIVPNSAGALVKTGGDNLAYDDVVPAAADEYYFNFIYITT